MPVDVIKKAAEEHEECMKSIDDAKSRVQVKHIGIGKTSKRIDKIPSVTAAFQRVPPSTSEGHEASPLLKERGCQEGIVMAAKFQNPRKSEQTQGAVVQQSVSSSMSAMTSATNETWTESNLIKERQQKRQKVLEQFLREAKGGGDLMIVHENKIREDFKRRQEAEEQKLCEEEKQKQILLDEALAKKLQDEEELKHKRQMECVMEEENRQEKLRQEAREEQIAEEFEKMQKQLSEDLKQQMELNYQQKI